MGTTHKWTDVSTIAIVLNGDATSPSIKNLAAGSGQISDEIDPAGLTTTFAPFADFRLRVRGQSAFAANALVQCWLVLDVGDAGAYEDGSASVFPQRPPDLQFLMRAVSTQQVIAERRIMLPPAPFKVILKNGTAVQFTNTDNENQLHISHYATQDV